MSLKGIHVLVTAGPTKEAIDPVRFISNHSSGKMGFNLANECVKRGANVTLIAGPVSIPYPEGVEVISVISAEEMYQAALTQFKKADVVILCAAVADYTPKYKVDQKIKKQGEEMTLELVKTKDIAFELGQIKEKQVMIGFALETNSEIAHAQEKLKKKNFDAIVLNSLRNAGTCFGSDNNQVSIIEHNNQFDYELKPKQLVAIDIIDYIQKKVMV